MLKCILFNVDNGPLTRRPIGAHRIAHFLRENNWDAEVIDFFKFWSFDQLQQLAKQKFTPDVKWIGISYLFLSSPIESVDNFFLWVKKEYPHIKIIVGSPIQYNQKSVYVDYNISGFGENALLELLKYLFSNGASPKFSLATHAGKQILANEMYPSYPMKSLNIIYEDRDFIQPEEWLGIEFARGCKFSCAFCNFPVIGVKGDYSRDAEDFEVQIKDAYDRFGVENYWVSDETFNDRTEKITKFADVVETLSFTPYFTGFIRPDLLIIRPQDREELLRMNFLGHFYGVETFNQETGKIIGKGMDPIKMKEGLIAIRKYYEQYENRRYRGSISLIAGLPYESIDSILQTKDWLIENWQGQNFTMYPLEIGVDEFDNPSKISKNWKKYGYVDASNDPDIGHHFAHIGNMQMNKIFIWKNDFTNLKEASDIAYLYWKEKYNTGNDFRLSNFALLHLGLPKNLDEKFSVKDTEEIEMYSANKIIQDYIEKKLNN